jgi:hypothetical protein
VGVEGGCVLTTDCNGTHLLPYLDCSHEKVGRRFTNNDNNYVPFLQLFFYVLSFLCTLLYMYEILQMLTEFFREEAAGYIVYIVCTCNTNIPHIQYINNKNSIAKLTSSADVKTHKCAHIISDVSIR